MKNFLANNFVTIFFSFIIGVSLATGWKMHKIWVKPLKQPIIHDTLFIEKKDTVLPAWQPDSLFERKFTEVIKKHLGSVPEPLKQIDQKYEMAHPSKYEFRWAVTKDSTWMRWDILNGTLFFPSTEKSIIIDEYYRPKTDGLPEYYKLYSKGWHVANIYDNNEANLY